MRSWRERRGRPHRTRRRLAFFPLARKAAVAALLLCLGACAGERMRLPPAPRWASGPACYAALPERDVSWAPATSPAANASCGVSDPIRVASAGTIDWSRDGLVACPLAAAMGAFASEAIQPAAMRYFGQPVLRLEHLGTWSCRRIAGFAGRWSQHAHGRAIDVAAFVLADGRRISVAEDWGLPGAPREFLRELARRGCDYFSVVLTPATNGDHSDHFHFDIGPDRACST
jgi:hypothetical protein